MSFKIPPPQQQYHSQNPYPATAVPPGADLRLAQKLQDEDAPPLPPIPENHQYNHYPSYQNNLSHCHHHNPSVIYASPNQPPLPYVQPGPYANGVGYYYSTQSHPFYNAQASHQHAPYRSVEEEDNSPNCLTGLYERFISVILIFAVITPLLPSCVIAVRFSRIKERASPGDIVLPYIIVIIVAVLYFRNDFH
ncbi:5927_t:CDS:2, partial [Acaulospora colombiana]